MSYYYYLVSSLPTLLFKDVIDFYSSNYIVNMCKNFISEKKFDALKNLSLIPDCDSYYDSHVNFIKKWYDFEINLRNKLALYRDKYYTEKISIQKKCFFSIVEDDVELYDLLNQIFSISNPLDRELILDKYRWKWLDDKENCITVIGFDNLCIYKLKTMICEKWNNRNVINGNKNLNILLDKLNKK